MKNGRNTVPVEGVAGCEDSNQTDASLPAERLNKFGGNFIFDTAQVIAQAISEVTASKAR